MKPITIIFTVVFYWFLLGVGLNFLLLDTLVTATGAGTNQTYSTFNTTGLNMTTTESTPETTSLKSFPDTLKMMFAFKTPTAIGIPKIIGTIISFMNWVLVIFFGLSVYRLINPFATP